MEEITAFFIRENAALVFSFAFYLAWWRLSFKPQNTARGVLSCLFLVFAAAFGFWGVWEFFSASAILAASGARLLTVKIFLVGLACYALLAAVTRISMKRPITAELFLIVCYAAFKTAEFDALAAARLLPKPCVAASFAALAFFTLVSLLCYLAYYKLNAARAYYCGALPPFLGAAMSGFVAALLFLLPAMREP